MGDGRSAAYWAYTMFAVTIFYGCWIGEVIATFQHLDSTVELLEAARIAIPVTTCIWIDIFIRLSVF
jgi:hypothetical protein